MLLALDWPSPCHWDGDDVACVTPAAWLVIWPCCGAKELMCVAHRLEAARRMAWGRVQHKVCRKWVDRLLAISVPPMLGGRRG